MKIKNIFILGVAGVLTLGMTGCKESFLDLDNPNSDDLATYFKNDAHIQEALVACYDPLHWPDWSNGNYNPINLSADVMSDQMNVGGATSSDMLMWQKMANFNADGNNTLPGLWTAEYSGVKRCNDLIAYVDALDMSATDVTEANAAYYKAQAHVLRAYYYLNLWKFWGNIPYYEKNLTKDDNYLAPQLTADEVYNKVIADLEATIDLDLLPMREADARAGYVTKAFAEMIYADFVLYQKDESRYQKAYDMMKEIIASGDYELNPSFAAIWEASGEWGSESIYEVNYNDANHQRGWDSVLAVGGTVLPRLLGPRGWESGLDGVDTGWSFGPVLKSTYEMYDEADTRRDATCYNADAVAEAAGKEYTHAWQHTGFFLKKYLPMVENVKNAGWDADLNFNNNLRIYRYAETLLNAAEFELLTNGDAGKAAEYVNKVRVRAGVTAKASVTYEEVIDERKLEFVGEGKRYFDLVRSGQAQSVLVAGSASDRTNNWSQNRKYLPIPYSELSADPNLKQNAGY